MKILILSDLHRGISGSYTASVHAQFTKCLPNNFDAIISAGDLGNHNIRHLRAGFRFLRRVAEDKPILHVMGNHCWWDKKIRTQGLFKHKLAKIAGENNIHMLHLNPIVLDDTLITGWNGWYAEDTRGMTNDSYWINAQRTQEIKEQARIGAIHTISTLETGVDGSYSKRIAVCHMPLGGTDSHFNERAWLSDQIYPVCDYFIHGHIHQRVSTEADGCKILSPGGHYNKPSWCMLDTETGDVIWCTASEQNQRRVPHRI